MQWRRVPWPLVALASVSVAWIASQSEIGARLELSLKDAGTSFLEHEIDSDVVVIGIDAKSLAELREWPWPRRHHAALLEKLAEAPPRRLFIDIDFSAESGPEDDERLASALAAWEDGPVVLPAFFQRATSSGAEIILTEPLERLRRNARIAAVNMEPGVDGLVRVVRRAWSFNGRILPSAVAVLSGLETDVNAQILVDFTISPSSFRYLSFSDIIANRTPAEYFADKTVFVGATAIELGDMVPVPIYKSLPGVVVQAMAYESARIGNHRAPSAGTYWLVLAAWSFAAGFLLCRLSWQKNVVLVTVSMAAIAVAALYLYRDHSLVVEIVPLSVVTVTAYLLATLRSLESETLRAVMFAVGYRKRNALLKSIVLSSTDCIVCIDETGKIQTANPSASSLFSCDMKALVGASVFEFIPALEPAGDEDRRQVFDRISASLLECDAIARGGEPFPVELSMSRVRLREEVLYTAIVRDISERRAQQRQLQFQATHDPLTTLPNRPALAAHLDARLGARDADSPVALLMIDLDRFKEVNDTLGHNVGDHVLHEVARRLADVAKGRGFLARIGGDEFALVVDRFDGLSLISQLSRDLAGCLKKPIETSGIAIEVGLSIGISIYPEHADDAESLFKYADVAMYSAKHAGVDFEFYDAANDRHSVRKLTIITRLRSAIADNQIELHYQPQVNLGTGRVESVEALLRWEDAVLGVVRPDEFIGLAETTDLIRPLSDWTLRRAFVQAVRWRDEGLHLRSAINLSARMLQDADLPRQVSALMQESGVTPDLVELEITESAMMADPERAMLVINELNDLGLLISVDDYGTGFSSLAYLRDLPVHALKLDKSFVTDLRQNGQNRVIVESTVQMAHALQLMAVAEGVETDADAELLAACGYDFAQGYLYSGAQPADRVSDWIRAFNAANRTGGTHGALRTG